MHNPKRIQAINPYQSHNNLLPAARWRKGYCLVPTILKAIALNYMHNPLVQRLLPYANYPHWSVASCPLAQRLLPCADYP